jgi:histone H3/H4
MRHVDDDEVSRKMLDAMTQARRDMANCISTLDALLFNAHDRRVNLKGLDMLLLRAQQALRRVYTLRHGCPSGAP